MVQPPMFGPSAVINPATYEPRAGKSTLMNELMADLAGKPDALAKTIISNCTTTLPMKFKFDPNENSHTFFFGTTREGMSKFPILAHDVLVALGSLKEKAETLWVDPR